MFVDGGVLCQLRMKGRGHDVVALDQRRSSRVFCKNLYARPGAFNHRPANKHHFEQLGLERGGPAHHIARDLPAIGVPNHGHVHQLERILLGMLHVVRQQNRPRARAKDGPSAHVPKMAPPRSANLTILSASPSSCRNFSWVVLSPPGRTSPSQPSRSAGGGTPAVLAPRRPPLAAWGLKNPFTPPNPNFSFFFPWWNV